MYSQRYAVRCSPFSFGGLPAAPSSPRLKDRNVVFGPTNGVVIITAELLTAKCTRAPFGNVCIIRSGLFLTRQRATIHRDWPPSFLTIKSPGNFESCLHGVP